MNRLTRMNQTLQRKDVRGPLGQTDSLESELATLDAKGPFSMNRLTRMNQTCNARCERVFLVFKCYVLTFNVE